MKAIVVTDKTPLLWVVYDSNDVLLVSEVT